MVKIKMRRRNSKSIREQRIVPVTSTRILKGETTLEEERKFAKRCEKLNE